MQDMAEALNNAMPAQRAQAELAAPMQARRDASAEPGKFPVVIYAPSFGAGPAENADLCEYLASEGYVVIASPSIGQSSRPMTPDLDGAEAQAADIEFLIGYAHSLPQADTNHLAVVGYSWGGLSNVLAAARDSRIDALVDLDGSVRYFPQVLKQATYATEARATAPLLFLTRPTDDFEQLPPTAPNHDTSPLNHMKFADVYIVKLTPMQHGNFSETGGQRLLGDKGYTDYSKEELSTAAAWMETYTLRFLDAYLKGDAKSRAFLDLPAAKTGAPAHLLTTRVIHSQGVPASRDTFAAELNRQGFDKAPEIYQAFKTRDADFTLSDNDLIFWGYDLIGRNEIAEAIAILKLDTVLHADSWNAFDSLGEAYADHGDKALAIAAYRQSLVLNPKNDNATDWLKKLGG